MKAPDFFRERKWVPVWLEQLSLEWEPEPFQWETGHEKGSSSLLHWRSSLGSPQLIGMHVLVEASVMGKAISVECAQLSRALQNSWLCLLPTAPFPSSPSPLPCLLSRFSCSSWIVSGEGHWRNFGELFVRGAHPLLCWNHLRMVVFYSFQQLQTPPKL